MVKATGLADRVRSSGSVITDQVRDIDEFIETATRVTRPHRIIPRGSASRFNGQMRAVESVDMAFAWMSYGTDVRVIPGEGEPDTFLLPISLAGRGRLTYGDERVDLTGSDAAIIAPYRPFHSEIRRDYEQVIVTIRRSKMEGIAAQLAQIDGADAVDLALATFEPSASVLALLEATATLAAEKRGAPSTALLARLEDLTVESILLSLPAFSERLQDSGDCRPRRLREAMRFMMEHLAEPIALGDVAVRAGMTPRGLQLAFRREVDQTPMSWLRDRRLDHARSLILNVREPARSVADSARASGFHHLGDFAAAFRRRFGESPSSLLRRLRDRARSAR